MYGKIFKQMYKGTLAMVGPWQALVTFQQLIVLSDRHGEVDMTADAISRETTIPLEIIQIGIASLEQPDPDSRSPDEEGRRIVRLFAARAWGWRIVNYITYSKIKSDEDRRAYHRKYYHDKRSPKLKSKLNNPQTISTQVGENSNENSTNSNHADADADVDAEKNNTGAARRVGFDPSTIKGLDPLAWAEWVAYRAKRKPPVMPESMQKAAECMAKLANQRAAVDYSIANGYQGLIEPKAQETAHHKFVPPRSADEIEAEERARASK